LRHRGAFTDPRATPGWSLAKLYLREGSAGDRVLLDPALPADFAVGMDSSARRRRKAELAADEYPFLLWNLARGSNPTV
jgi:hypothetical protein